MKVLSIKQPWADLIVRGLKDVENRTWKTKYRGPLLIHAGRSLLSLPGYIRTFYGPEHEWELGGVIGIVDLVDVVSNSKSPWADPSKDSIHWVVANPRRVDFFACIGKLSLFDVEWPPSAEALNRSASLKKMKRDERGTLADHAKADAFCTLQLVAERLPLARLREIANGVGVVGVSAESADGHDLAGLTCDDFVRRFRGRLDTVLHLCSLDEVNALLVAQGARTKKRLDDAIVAFEKYSYEDDYLDEPEPEPDGELVAETGIIRDPAWLYWIDDEGSVRRGRAPEDADLDELSLADLLDVEVVRERVVKPEDGFLFVLGATGKIYRQELEDGDDGDDGELVGQVDVAREDGWLYFIDDETGDLRRGRGVSDPENGFMPEQLADLETLRERVVTTEAGFSYELDDDGRILRFAAPDDDEAELDEQGDDDDAADKSRGDEGAADDDAADKRGIGEGTADKLTANERAADERGADQDEKNDGDGRDEGVTPRGPEKVFKLGIVREPGWLYYFDNGNVMRTRMVASGARKAKAAIPEVVFVTDVVREDGFIYYIDVEGDVSRAPPERRPSRRRIKTPAARATASPMPDGAIGGAGNASNADLNALPTDAVMAAFRQAVRGQGLLERDELLRLVARELGFQRLGSRIEEILRGHLRTAIRRRIIEADGKQIRAGAGTLEDYSLEELRDELVSNLRRGQRTDRESATRAAMEALGFKRLTDGARSTMKSAMNSAIRQGLIAYEGSEVIWRV